MKKRIISLLMALLMVLGMFPSAAFAAEADLCDVCGEPGCETEHIWCDSCAVYDCGADHSAPAEETAACAVCGSVNCETEHVYCAVCAEYDCGLDHEAGLCPVCKAADCETEHVWCDSCGVYDCGTDHSVPAPTPAVPAVDCSGDIGMYARLNPYFAESYVEVFDGVQVYSLLYTDFASDLVLTVANWHYDAASGYLWYQVYTAAGTLPQGMADGWWIRQAEAADNAGEKTLILTSPLAPASEGEGEGAGDTAAPDDTAAPGDISEAGDTASPDDGTGAETVVCPVCGSENCEAEHIQCAVCQEYDCTESHVWCDSCQKYDCGVNHSVCSVCGAVGCTEHSPCGVCGEYACEAEHIRCAACGSYDCTISHVWCDICKGYDCGVDHSSDIAARYGAYVGKYARIVVYPDLTGFFVCDGTSFDSSNAIPIYFSELEENSAFSIDSWYYDEATTGVWFRVSFVSGGVTDSGAEFWPEECWILHDYLAADDKNPPALELVELSSCPVCGKLNCNVQHEPCGICGEVSCSGTHFFCEICESYTCTLQHLYCNVCERYDCPIDHSHRSRLTKFARSADYTESSAPITSPDIIPPSGGYGDVVISHNGVACSAITLLQGTRDSLSAWGAYADYQWQIRYDEARDLWADIKEQTAQGIVLSPAMFIGAFPGGASIRCRMGSGEAAVYSSPVAVSFAAPVAESFRDTVGAMLPTTDVSGDSDKQYVVVQYLYADGRIAAANRIYELPVGKGLKDQHSIPVIPGYKASLDSSFDGKVTLADNVLYLDFPDGTITGNPATITVRYNVDYVDYTVIHYLQNVDNDNYAEYEREVVSNVKKTGQVIDTAHKSYSGFYNLLYETPAAAADGSTVIEVYYDRYYYLMTFDMGEGGYGTDPIYARYGSPVKADDPSRPGYTFLGWSLDGSTVVELPSTMPAGNVQYTAVWEATDKAKVSIVVWGENADDEEYSYIKTMELYVKPGTTFTYSEDGTRICGLEEHDHAAEGCSYTCGITEHSHSVAAGCYRLICNESTHNHVNDGCTLSCSHTHDLSCYAAENGSLTEQTKPDRELTDRGNGIWTYTTYVIIFPVTHYWLNIDGIWYASSSEDTYEISLSCSHSHNDGCYTCGQQNSDHIHSLEGGCYELICTQGEHTHSDSCGYDCGKTAHSHSSECYMNGAGMESDLWKLVGSDTVTVEANGSTVMNVYYDRVEKTLTFKYDYRNRDYQETRTITEKWGADISDQYEAIAAAAGTTFWTLNRSGNSGPYTNYFGIMPEASATYYTQIKSNDEGTMKYFGESLSGVYEEMFSVGGVGGYTVTIEDRYEFLGFTYHHGTGVGSSCGGAEFYYTRNSYNLDFNNGVDVTWSESVKYEAPLDGYADYVPQAPDIYEPGSVVFAGWYLNPECSEGAEFDLNGKIMPAENIILYAKWELVEHKVNYYMTRDSLDRGENIPAEMQRLVAEAVAGGAAQPETDPYTTVFSENIVKHGGMISNPADPGVSKGYENIHPRAGYTFVGWFYINEEGKETAFDPEHMPVDKDLDLYGKWSANKLCQYNVYFALDENADGVADLDAGGSVIHVAAPLNGSGIAGHTYTFTAKGEAELYNGYKDGYFPNVGSHSITIDINDDYGTGNNSFTFLYQPKAAVPYTVKYLEKGTEKVLHEEKYVGGNRNVIVTETFEPVSGYMPDAYQKTLVVSAENGAVNEIIFWYTEDKTHSVYVVNHYTEIVDSDNQHLGWSKYTSFQNTGDIDLVYSAEAISIDGFTLSEDYTDGYNVSQKVNGATNTPLPSLVSGLYGTKNTINGTLGAEGMELNFYYVRSLYPYEFRFVLKDVGTVLLPPETGKAPYDTVVSMKAPEIRLDLDGDGIEEEYRLYDPTENEKEIHIRTDGDPLAADAAVAVGLAKVNIATFEYIRCTEDISVTKALNDISADSDPDAAQLFNFRLQVHITDGYGKNSYDTVLSNGTEEIADTVSPKLTEPEMIYFSLKAGETLTIKDLPTAKYTLTELSLPTGYTSPSYEPAQSGILELDKPIHFTVTNTFNPAALEISKTVDVVEENGNVHEVESFEMTVAFPEGAALENSYDCIFSGNGENRTETVTADYTNRTMTVSLKRGETARFPNLPAGAYTVTEADYSPQGYDSSCRVNGGAYSAGSTAAVTLENGSTSTVEYNNKFPVGDLTVRKTVTKEFYNTPWSGDSFEFTIVRTDEGRTLRIGNEYEVYEGSTRIGSAAVADDNSLSVTVKFDEADAEILMEKGTQAVHAYTIRNLPAGTYTVTETKNGAYKQSELSVSGITIPAETAPEAGFVNILTRPTGSLSLEKILEAAIGFNPAELPEGTVFSFTVMLLESAPEQVTVSKTQQGSTTELVMTASAGLELELLENETVLLEGLPIGKYRIIEHSLPSYANSFAVRSGEDFVRQPAATLENGNLYTDVEVLTDAESQVLCTNTYPVERAELILQKLYCKEYERDELPSGDDISRFAVSFEEKDCVEYYYTVYSDTGTKVGDYTAVASAVTDPSTGDEDYSIEIPLSDGQYAVITGGLTDKDKDGDGQPDTVHGTPVCGYTVTEISADTVNYKVSYELYQSEKADKAPSVTFDKSGTPVAEAEAVSLSRTLASGKTDILVFTNEYRRHLGQLTVNKAVSGTGASDSFIFHINSADNSVDMDVVINGSGSVTVYDLPMGSYTVTEDTDWSWRYTPTAAASQTVSLSLDSTSAEVFFANSFSEDQWLDKEISLVNTFTGVSGNS